MMFNPLEFCHLKPQGGNAVARRRSNYGYEKRAKEIARKKKKEEKLKRRQEKSKPENSTEESESDHK